MSYSTINCDHSCSNTCRPSFLIRVHWRHLQLVFSLIREMIQKNQSKRNVAFPYQNLNQILRRLTHRIKNIYQKIKINAWVPGEPDNVGFTSSVVCRLAAAAVGGGQVMTFLRRLVSAVLGPSSICRLAFRKKANTRLPTDRLRVFKHSGYFF